MVFFEITNLVNSHLELKEKYTQKNPQNKKNAKTHILTCKSKINENKVSIYLKNGENGHVTTCARVK